ncbi:MAG: adenylate/guanylate cyclase domain-containing protein [Alphaproteobacteria bacterium]
MSAKTADETEHPMGGEEQQREAAASLIGWILEAALQQGPIQSLLAELCVRIRAQGLPLIRGSIGLNTLHPSIGSRSYAWWHNRDSVAMDFPREGGNGPGFEESPFARMLYSSTPTLRRRLESEEEIAEFPIFRDLHAAGGTGYYAMATAFGLAPNDLSQANGMVSSWLTDRPGGFADGHIQTLTDLMPALALAVQAAKNAEIARNIATTYLGADAGGRVLAGQITVGGAHSLTAVLVFTDLRGFTAIADRIPRDETVRVLNAYFKPMVEPISRHGGQVLKFMGDGLLAIFPLDDTASAETVCGSARTAMEEMRRELHALTQTRTAAGEPVMELDTSVHLGEVQYGNVGSADRMDFTVIGPAVNEASRIEGMCRALDRDILISNVFADACGRHRARLLPLGRYGLRGVKAPQALFTLYGEAADSNNRSP